MINKLILTIVFSILILHHATAGNYQLYQNISISEYNKIVTTKKMPSNIDKNFKQYLEETTKINDGKLPTAILNNDFIELKYNSHKVTINIIDYKNQIIKINDTKLYLGQYHTHMEKVKIIENLFAEESKTSLTEYLINLFISTANASCVEKLETKISKTNKHYPMPERKGLYKLPKPAMWASAIGMLIWVLFPASWPALVHKLGAYAIFGSGYLVNEKQRKLLDEEKELREIYLENSTNEVIVRDSIKSAQKGNSQKLTGNENINLDFDPNYNYEEINFLELYNTYKFYTTEQKQKLLSTKEFSNLLLEANTTEAICAKDIISAEDIINYFIQKSNLDPNKVIAVDKSDTSKSVNDSNQTIKSQIQNETTLDQKSNIEK